MNRTLSIVLPLILAIIMAQVEAQTPQSQPSTTRPMNITVDVDDCFVPVPPGGEVKVPVEAPPIRIDINKVDARFYNGESIVFTATIRRNLNGYLYLFVVDSEKNTKCIFPNAWHYANGINHTVKGGDQITIPGEGSGFRFRATAPFGKDTIFAVLSQEPLDPARVGAQSFTDSMTTAIDTIRLMSVVEEMLAANVFIGQVAITTLSKEAASAVVTHESSPMVIRPVRPGFRLFQR